MFGIAEACPASAAPSGRSVMYSAIIRFWVSVSPSALTFIDPVVRASRICSGVRCRSESLSGARLSAAGFVWQVPQRCSKTPSA